MVETSDFEDSSCSLVHLITLFSSRKAHGSTEISKRRRKKPVAVTLTIGLHTVSRLPDAARRQNPCSCIPGNEYLWCKVNSKCVGPMAIGAVRHRTASCMSWWSMRPPHNAVCLQVAYVLLCSTYYIIVDVLTVCVSKSTHTAWHYSTKQKHAQPILTLELPSYATCHSTSAFETRNRLITRLAYYWNVLQITLTLYPGIARFCASQQFESPFCFTVLL